MTELRKNQVRRTSSVLRRALGLTFAVVVATGIFSSAPASAGSPGAFNIAECKPGTQQIQQQVEVYRSYAGEYIALQGALVEAGTGTVSYSGWTWGEGATAYTVVDWSTVPRGSYAVYYQWASWNSQTGQWTLSGWVGLTGAQLNSFGPTETMPGSGLYISPGPTTGYCAI